MQAEANTEHRGVRRKAKEPERQRSREKENARTFLHD